jgi:hypothetical protein
MLPNSRTLNGVKGSERYLMFCVSDIYAKFNVKKKQVMQKNFYNFLRCFKKLHR